MPYPPKEIDFDKMVLTKSEKRILRKLKSGKNLKFNDSDVLQLIRWQMVKRHHTGVFISGHMVSDGTYEISDNGKRYFEYRKKQLINLLVRSIFLPVVLAAVTAFITTLITIWLKGSLQ